ncbi:hypothetical protein KY285_018663 [Solanum tuberosum]|nr:hypothetical protein KY285_018663 [Solanum tuberosum]
MNNLKRSWMYERLDGRGAINSSFITGVNDFLKIACSHRNHMSGEEVRCPCDCESNSNPGQRTLIFLFAVRLEPSSTCSSRICESFKTELDPKGTNWKSVPQETKDFYLGEFEKEFYWDLSIDSEVKIQWRRKATIRYNNFIFGLKKEGEGPKYIPEETWESWMSIWKNPEVIEKSKINSRNRCGGENAVAKGTHTGGSITIGEHRKRLAIKNGRDLTPSEIHLHVHTHGHDGKSFVGERAQIVHVLAPFGDISSKGNGDFL